VDGQLARNVWRTSSSSWKGWEDLDKPAAEIVGAPAVAQLLSWRLVVVKCSDNKLYLRYTEDDAEGWRPWEQGDKLKSGQLKDGVAIFIIDEDRRSPELVVVGRSLENEMASISLRIHDS
jgi:hypothetical protein